MYQDSLGSENASFGITNTLRRQDTTLLPRGDSGCNEESSGNAHERVTDKLDRLSRRIPYNPEAMFTYLTGHEGYLAPGTSGFLRLTEIEGIKIPRGIIVTYKPMDSPYIDVEIIYGKSTLGISKEFMEFGLTESGWNDRVTRKALEQFLRSYRERCNQLEIPAKWLTNTNIAANS